MKNARLSLLVAILWGGCMSAIHAQCIDMTTLDDGSKRFIQQDAGITFHSEGAQGKMDSIGWKDAYLSPSSHPRQTLITSAGTDNLCGDLSVLPPDLTTSVRLMNDGYQAADSAKGAWIVFRLTVDADRPIVLINYAAVMEAGKHANIPGWYQSYCGFYVQNLEPTDKDYGQLYGDLYHYASVESSIKGWKSFNNASRNNVLTVWKDWSKVGLDLSKWAGKTIGVVLINYDCAISSIANSQVSICTDHHESHMYGHVTCVPKKLYLNKDCTFDEDSISITAPEGFSYKWYKKGEADKTLSTDRIFRALAEDEDATYCCELTNHVGSFTLEQEVGATTIVEEEPVSLGFGQTYTWARNGKTYRVSGVYEDTVFYTGSEYNECAKTIYRLPLTVAELNCPGKFTVIDSICGDARGITVRYHYNEQYDTSDEDKTDTIQPSIYSFKVDFPDKWTGQNGEEVVIDSANHKIVKSGYQNIETAIVVDSTSMDGTFIIPIPLDSVTNMYGEKVYAYPRPDTYRIKLYAMNLCNQEQEVDLEYTILYPSFVIYQRWNDVLSIHNERYNGGYPIASVKWYRDGKEISGSGAHNAYTRQTDLVTDIDSYYAVLTRSDDGKSFCTCRFTPARQEQEDTPQFKGKLEIAPRLGNTRQLQVLTETSGVYTLYDLSGRVLQTGIYGDAYGAPDVLISSAVLQGTYILQFRTSDGQLISKKHTVK